MARHILYCLKCKKYTMKDSCPICNAETVANKPPKYSPEDKYGDLRRKVKEPEYKAKGLI